MAGQTVLPVAQLPVVQIPELQLCPLAQAWPQEPQLAGSVPRFTGAPPGVHWVVLTLVQVPAVQTCCAPQTFPQPAQLSWLVFLSTQAPLQARLLGAVQVVTHAPPLQDAAPP